MRASAAAVVVAALLGGCELVYPFEDEGDRYGVVILPDAAAGPRDAPPGQKRHAVLHYRFEGNVANTGTLGADFDGSGTSITYVAGRVGQAVAFDATWTTQVVLPTQMLLSARTAYTIGLWFREDAVLNTGAIGYLFRNRGAGGFETYHGANSQALTTCSDAGCNGFGYSVGTWHHLIYRWAGDAGPAPLEIYVDNVLVTTLPASDVYFAPSQTSITLGTRTNMQIDEAVVYDTVFTLADQCSIVVGGAWNGTDCVMP